MSYKPRELGRFQSMENRHGGNDNDIIMVVGLDRRRVIVIGRYGWV